MTGSVARHDQNPCKSSRELRKPRDLDIIEPAISNSTTSRNITLSDKDIEAPQFDFILLALISYSIATMVGTHHDSHQVHTNVYSLA